MSLALVHLVRKSNGTQTFRAFLDSYRSVSAGTEHDLVLLLKGFSTLRDAREHLALAAETRTVTTVLVPDAGFDLGAYFAAADRLDHRHVCFVNSFTTMRVPGWLGALRAALDSERIGLVGATCSYASHWSWMRFELGLANKYAGVFPIRAAAQEQMLRLAEAQGLLERRPGRVRRWLSALVRSPSFVRGFDEFPAHHVRTNGFLLETALMRSLDRRRMKSKIDAYRLEGGTSSVTRQVEALGLAAVVVGANGCIYERPNWPMSRTFWQSDQENRLLDDNQTRVYGVGDPLLRKFLAEFAWGPAASPAPPSSLGAENVANRG